MTVVRATVRDCDDRQSYYPRVGRLHPPESGVSIESRPVHTLSMSGAVALTSRRRWAALGVLVSGLMVIGLDLTILSVALPTLAAKLGATTTELQWMVASYVVVFAALLLPAGLLSDRYGRRRVFLIGLLLFGVTSAAAAASPSAVALIAARAGMGLAAAIIGPVGLSIMPTIFPPEERRRAIAVGSVAIAIASPLGPLVAGYLLEHYPWGSVFLINVPLVIATAVAGRLLIPESRGAGPFHLDVAGMVLSSAGLALLVYGIIQAPMNGLGGPVIPTCIGLGSILLVAFVAWERRAAHPLVDLGLFANARFSVGTAATAMVSFAVFGATFLVPQYLQLVSGDTSLQTGVRLLPVVASQIVAAGLSDVLTTRLGTRIVVASGLTIAAVAFGILSLLSPDSGYLVVAIALVLLGAGLGLALTPSLDAVISALPVDRLSVGSAVNSTLRQVAGALSVAVLGSIFASTYSSRLSAATHGLAPAAAQTARESMAGALVVAGQVGGAPGARLVAAADSAFTTAMAAAFVVAAALTMVVAALALAFLPAREGSRHTQPAPDAAGGAADPGVPDPTA